jgi:hypothetical protein
MREFGINDQGPKPVDEKEIRERLASPGDEAAWRACAYPAAFAEKP